MPCVRAANASIDYRDEQPHECDESQRRARREELTCNSCGVKAPWKTVTSLDVATAAAKRNDRFLLSIRSSESATLRLGSRWLGCCRTGTRRRRRGWWCGNSRSSGVVGAYDCLRDVRSWRPQKIQPALLRRPGVVQQHGKSVLLQVFDDDRPELLLNLLDRLLHVGAIRRLRVICIALQLLLLGIDVSGTRGLLVVVHGSRRVLQLLGQRIDVRLERVHLGLRRLIFLLNVGYGQDGRAQGGHRFAD